MAAYFSCFLLELNAGIIKLEQVLRPIDVLNRSKHLRNSTVKYKFIFSQGVVLGVAVVIAYGP